MFEVHLDPHWSLEVNGLFRQLHGSVARVLRPEDSLGDQSPQPVVTWEFPVLAKYRFQRRTLSPFFEAGPSFRTTGNLNTEPSHHGIAAGAGFEMKWRSLKIAPALRYTLWAGEKHTQGAPDRSGSSRNPGRIQPGIRVRLAPFGPAHLVGLYHGHKPDRRLSHLQHRP